MYYDHVDITDVSGDAFAQRTKSVPIFLIFLYLLRIVGMKKQMADNLNEKFSKYNRTIFKITEHPFLFPSDCILRIYVLLFYDVGLMRTNYF